MSAQPEEVPAPPAPAQLLAQLRADRRERTEAQGAVGLRRRERPKPFPDAFLIASPDVLSTS